MVLPEANDPKPEVERQPSFRGKILPFVPPHTPDWLTGPRDELRAVSDPTEEEGVEVAPEGLAKPVLSRPGPTGPEPGRGRAALRPAAEPGAARPAQPGGSRPAPPAAAWTAAASSLPVLKLPLPAEPQPQEAVPVPAKAASAAELPGGQDDGRQASAAPPPLQALEEPWWLIALDTLRTNLKVRLAAAGAVVCIVLLACWMWPRGVGGTLLSQMRRHPAQYDGRTVTVRGRVGDDVFALGGGWAFYLVQGRDTIVAFTRSRAPRPRAVVTVEGQVSTGFLDGVPRQALFEQTTAKK